MIERGDPDSLLCRLARAGQEIFHVHLHVIPRDTGDGFGLRFPEGYSLRPRSELDEAAAALQVSWPG